MDNDIKYSGLNKKFVTIIVACSTLLIGAIIFYTLFDNEAEAQDNKLAKVNIKKDDNKQADVKLIINNILAAKTEEAKTTVLPPIEDKQIAQMGSPKEGIGNKDKKDEKPTMFTNEGASENNANDTNAISGVNSSIGTGTINSKYKALSSPYIIFAGSYIPAQMVNGINSDLDGMVVAQVRSNVYDTVTGKHLLIPQGSRMVGTYNHNVAFGQNRLMVGWNRVIFPNGGSFLLHGQPGTDLEGYSGFSDEVDNHYVKIFGSAFIMGAIFGTTSVAMGAQNTNPYQQSAGATIATQVGAQMAQAGIQIISKGLNIAPTIIIHPGYRFNTALTADLKLRPYIYKDEK